MPSAINAQLVGSGTIKPATVLSGIGVIGATLSGTGSVTPELTLITPIAAVIAAVGGVTFADWDCCKMTFDYLIQALVPPAVITGVLSASIKAGVPD